MFLALLAAAPADQEARMIHDAEDGRFHDFSVEAAAIIAAGPREPATVTAAQATLKAKLAPVLKESHDARGLLASLLRDHGKGAVLKRYAPAASSLYETIATGRYGPTSGALLYYFAAEKADLEPAVVLHNTDVCVRVGSELVRFGPAPDVIQDDPEVQALTPVLFVALIYAHKALIASDKFDADGFTAALTKANKLAQKDVSARAYLFALLMQRAMEPARPAEETMGLFHYALASAPNDDARVRVQHAADIVIERRLGDDKPLDAETWGALLKPFAKLRYESLARLYLKGNDLPGAAMAIDAGRRSCQDECDALTALDVERLTRWSEQDGDGAGKAFLQRYGVGVYLTSAKVIAKNQVVSILREHRCSDAQAASEAWFGVLEPFVVDQDIEACFVDKAAELIRARRYDAAATELRTAMKTVKDDSRVRTTLVNAVSRQAMELIKQRRCDDAKPWLEEGRGLDPNESLFDQGLAYCAGQR